MRGGARSRQAANWGKIGSLPFAVLLDLCARMRRGDSAADLLSWLNRLPIVRTRLRAQFSGRSMEIRSEDLAKWQRSGLQIYLRHLAQTAGTPSVPVSAKISLHRKGKIARLPYQIRHEVNQRLLDGKSGRSIVAWLNGQQAVIARLDMYFGGSRINAQNVSTWKRGGFQDYLRALNMTHEHA